MTKLLDLIIKMQEKGFTIHEVLKTELDYYIISFKSKNNLFTCNVSAYCFSYPHETTEDVKEILNAIHFTMQTLKLN